MKKFLIISALCLLLLFSCTTKIEYVTQPLPDFNPAIPARPELKENDIIGNTIKLMSYAEELELYGESWKNFYEKLKNN